MALTKRQLIQTIDTIVDQLIPAGSGKASIKKKVIRMYGDLYPRLKSSDALWRAVPGSFESNRRRH